MYKRRKSSGLSFKVLIFLGIFAGMTFVAYDKLTHRGDGPAATPINQPITGPQTAASSNTTVNTAATSPDAQTASAQSPDSFAGAEIFIPSAGIIAPITQVYLDGVSWDVSRLGTNVGHLQGTSWLDDQPGNIVLSGHVELSDGRQGIFANLSSVQVGQIITVSRGSEQWNYIIVSVETVEPDDLTPLYPSEHARLTLITCGGYNFFADRYQVRTVVIADRVS